MLTWLYNYLLYWICYFTMKDKPVMESNKILYLLREYNKYMNKKYPLAVKRIQQDIRSPYSIENNKVYCCVCGPNDKKFGEDHYRIVNNIFYRKCYHRLVIFIKDRRTPYNRVIANIYLGNTDSKSILSKIPEVLIKHIIYYL